MAFPTGERPDQLWLAGVSYAARAVGWAPVGAPHREPEARALPERHALLPVEPRPCRNDSGFYQ